MSDGATLCYGLVLVISIALVIFGFAQILGRQVAPESDAQVIQRQLRGFAWLMLSQIVLFLGAALCTGLNFDLRALSRSWSRAL